jgi:hypothetical protein
MRSRVVVALAGVITLVIGLTVFQASSLQLAGDADVVKEPPVLIGSLAASAFRTEFLPLLERAEEQAGELVEMGKARDRNLFRVRAEQEAMTAALADADAWLAAHPPSAADAPAVDAYRNGASAIREAMNEAQAGFLHLDFDRVAAATVTMQSGHSALEQAIGLLALRSTSEVGLRLLAELAQDAERGLDIGGIDALQGPARHPGDDREQALEVLHALLGDLDHALLTSIRHRGSADQAELLELPQELVGSGRLHLLQAREQAGCQVDPPHGGLARRQQIEDDPGFKRRCLADQHLVKQGARRGGGESKLPAKWDRRRLRYAHGVRSLSVHSDIVPYV